MVGLVLSVGLVGGASHSAAASTSTRSAEPITNGVYTFEMTDQPGKVMDTYGYISAGQQIRLNTRHTDIRIQNQAFELRGSIIGGIRYYQAVSRISYTGGGEAGKLCLDVEGANTEPGARVILWPCHGGDNQLWELVNIDGDYVFENKHSRKYVGVDSEGKVIQTGTATYPKWRLRKENFTWKTHSYNVAADEWMTIHDVGRCTQGWHYRAKDADEESRRLRGEDYKVFSDNIGSPDHETFESVWTGTTYAWRHPPSATWKAGESRLELKATRMTGAPAGTAWLRLYCDVD